MEDIEAIGSEVPNATNKNPTPKFPNFPIPSIFTHSKINTPKKTYEKIPFACCGSCYRIHFLQK